MTAYPLTLLVLLLIVLLQLWMMMRVAQWRGRSGIKAPAMTGDPALERAIRVHMNTIEQLAMFLPALLVCAAYSPKFRAFPPDFALSGALAMCRIKELSLLGRAVRKTSVVTRSGSFTS